MKNFTTYIIYMYNRRFLGAMLIAALMATSAALSIPALNLLSASNFTFLAQTGITGTTNSVINGNIGLSPAAGSYITGIAGSNVTGGYLYVVDANGPAGSVQAASMLTTAIGDVGTAYTDAAGRTPVPTGNFLNPGSGNIGGLNLSPGLYKFTGACAITGSNVTLTGNATDVWIFQIGSNLNVGSGIHIILAGGAQAANVFWQVGSAATLGTYSSFKGTILAYTLVSLGTGAALEGRAFAGTAITMSDAVIISKPVLLPSFTINLHRGWNMISSNIIPQNIAMSSVWNNIDSNLLIIKDASGSFWMPPSTGSLTNWNVLNGYQVYMTAATTLVIAGAIEPSSTPIHLTASGWYIVSYLPQVSMQASDALSSLGNKLVLAKNGNGEIYWPGFEINTFENSSGKMVVGKGYQLYVVDSATLIYPSSARTMAVEGFDKEPKPIFLETNISNTGNNANMIIQSTSMAEGVEIGAYNGRNELIGSGVMHNGRASLVVWGEDIMSKVLEGAAEGETLTLKSYNPENGNQIPISIKSIDELITGSKSKTITYRQNGLYIINTEISFEQNELSVRSTPNPSGSSSIIEFTLPEAGNAVIELYNVLGIRVAQVANSNYEAGSYKLNFNEDGISSGVYMLVLINGYRIATQSMINTK